MFVSFARIILADEARTFLAAAIEIAPSGWILWSTGLHYLNFQCMFSSPKLTMRRKIENIMRMAADIETTQSQKLTWRPDGNQSLIIFSHAIKSRATDEYDECPKEHVSIMRSLQLSVPGWQRTTMDRTTSIELSAERSSPIPDHLPAVFGEVISMFFNLTPDLPLTVPFRETSPIQVCIRTGNTLISSPYCSGLTTGQNMLRRFLIPCH